MYDDELLTPDTVLRGLQSALVPQHVLCYTQVTSTMDVAREHLGRQPWEAFPLLVQAEEQTAGRGRMRRPWSAAPGETLLFSLALRPRSDLPPDQAQVLIWMAGVSICEGIRRLTPLHPRLKWPNDVLLPLSATDPLAANGVNKFGKVAGILLESGSSAERVEWAIIGCGLNVNATPARDTQLRYPATSIANALGSRMSRLQLLRAILESFDTWYAQISQGNTAALFAEWRELLVTIGQQVQITLDQDVLHGLAEDVESSGALRVRDASGTLHIVNNGDVGS